MPDADPKPRCRHECAPSEFRTRRCEPNPSRHSRRMHNMALSWQQAAILAAVLVALGVACRVAAYPRLQAIAPFARESGYVAGLYALWQLAATVSLLGTSGALAQACNLYYATMHFAGLGALLLWLFLRHRDRYPQVRTTIVLLTASCLLVQLVPVAPPRLLPKDRK